MLREEQKDRLLISGNDNMSRLTELRCSDEAILNRYIAVFTDLSYLHGLAVVPAISPRETRRKIIS